MNKLLCVLLALLFATPAAAQNPDLILTQAERDSVLRTYHSVFPLLGRKAIAAGFDVPYAVGVNVIGMYLTQGLEFGQLGLSTGDNPVQGVDFIKFGQNTNQAITANARVDLWVLPFLNVCGLYRTASSPTTLAVSPPRKLQTGVAH